MDVFDQPGLQQSEGWTEETVEFQTYILIGNQFQYQINWNRTVKSNNGKWGEPVYDVTLSRVLNGPNLTPAQFLPSGIDIKSKTWLWHYNTTTKKYETIKNLS